MAEIDNEKPQAGRSWLLLRPPAVIFSLPLEYRWEFTRRHPYYLQLWQLARRRHEQPRHEDPSERVREEVASQILGGIGVSASVVPPDPQLGADALGPKDLGAAWEGGAVAPATFRTLAHMLLAALPAPQRSQLGRLLVESSEFDSGDVGHMLGVHERLDTMGEPAWDSFPSAPVLSVNLQMPQRAIAEAVEQLVRRWKHDRAISEQRRRDDKLAFYLATWDAREGWSGNGYASRERTFREISQATGDPIPTVVSRYRTAFHYLTGHDYTPSLWINVMGPLKLKQLVLGSTELVQRRPWRSPNLRPVSESVLLPGRKEWDRYEFLEVAGVTASDIALVDLSMDIATLLDLGRTDDQIIEELEISLPQAAAKCLVVELRHRHEDR